MWRLIHGQYRELGLVCREVVMPKFEVYSLNLPGATEIFGLGAKIACQDIRNTEQGNYQFVREFPVKFIVRENYVSTL
jgi:hypothetical protein